MPIHIEPLTQGLVTAKDASLLEPGELVQAASALYRPYNDAISPIKGRQVFGSAIGANITGLRAIPFEADTTTTTRLLVGHGTVWQTGTGGAWTTIRSGLSTFTRLEAIGFENEYFISDGVNGAYHLNSSGSIRAMGMEPTEDDDFTVANVANGSGLWDQDGQAERAFYYYWITEYDSVRDIESILDGDGDQVFVLSATNTIRISILYGSGTYTTKHNANADKWRVYRSEAIHGVNPDSTYPIGFLVGTVDIPVSIATTTFDDIGNISDIPYAILTLSVAGAAASDIERDGEPPAWYTGDIFEDSMVLNDIAEPGVVRYSFPGMPHSYPSLYFIGFNTKQVDRVTCIKSLDAVCVVGLQSQVWRLNYLPNETDSEFSRGRCREVISANHGITGPDAACIFTPVEGASRVAYVSHDGLYMTDGIRTQLLTMDLDWDALVNKSELPNARLVNVQHLWSLFLYYTSNGGSAPNNRVLHLSYHPQHLKEGGYLKVSGPTSLECRAADYANNSSRMFAGTTSVQEEDVVAGQSTAVVETRFIYPEGATLATETSAERLRILTGPFNGAGTFNAAFTRRKSNTAKITDTAKTYTPHATENQLIRMELHARAEAVGVLLNTQADTAYVAFEYNVASGT